MKLVFKSHRPKQKMEADNHNDLRLYEEAYLRWLRMRRDYPWLNEPPPPLPPTTSRAYGKIIREMIERDFNR